MKIAIVCDWLVTYAGAEKVLTELIQCFPTADLFAIVDFLPDSFREQIGHKKATTTFIQKLPGAKKYYRHYLPLMPLAIEQLDVSQYDLVISSSHAVAKGVITGPDQIHIAYVHSPMRYAWDLQHQYLQEAKLDRGLKSFLIKTILHKMRLWDTRTANGVDYFLTNSNFIARRIWKTYRREATVIYPPVNTTDFLPYPQKENFYLAVSRFVPYKKMDLIVDSFAAMPDKKLIVIGDGPDFNKVKAKIRPNITLLGFQPQATLIHYLQRAKALVFAAIEDFGIILLEAQACGTPVIAFDQGGAKEAIKTLADPNPTSILFSEQNETALCQAVNHFEEKQSLLTVENCRMNAMQFSTEQFRKAIHAFVTHLGLSACE